MTTKYSYCCKNEAIHFPIERLDNENSISVPDSAEQNQNTCCENRVLNSIEGLNSAIPESARLVAERCSTIIVSVQSGGSTQQTNVQLTPGAPIPYVDVGTKPASATTYQRGNNVLNIAIDPYNPATRFSQYFPPPPLPYVCPVRMPSNDPKPSVRPCNPISRFPNSK